MYVTLLAAFLAASPSSVSSAPFLPASMEEWQLDLVGRHDELRRYVSELADPRPEVWRRALIRVALAGEPGLNALSASRALRDSAFRDRARHAVSMALRLTVTTQQLDLYPSLRSLGQDEIDRGIVCVEVLARQTTVDTHVKEFQQILHMSGFRAYAGVALATHERPVARAYGARVLNDIVPWQTLRRRLLSDGAEVVLDHEDYRMYTNVAQSVDDVAWPARVGQQRSDWFENGHTIMEIDYGVSSGWSEFTNTIRQCTRECEARTWDDWWQMIDPLWREWWNLAGDRAAADRETWVGLQTAANGYRLDSRPDSLGRTSFHLLGPPGTTCEVFVDSVRVSSSHLPVHIVGRPNPTFIQWRYGSLEIAGSQDPFPNHEIEIRAKFPDGSAWYNAFIHETGSDLTIVLVPPSERPAAFRVLQR